MAAVKCINPPTVTNGILEFPLGAPNAEYPYATVLQYRCHGNLQFDDGYVTKSVFCADAGQWNVTTMSCGGKSSAIVVFPALQ